MAVLNKIIVKDFRNIGFAEVAFSRGINCICGDNGQGKTNLLDAIHYLSIARSAFSPSDSFCYRHGTGAFSISGTYSMPDGLVSKFSISVSREGKTLRRDDKAYARISGHMGVLPVVMVSPQDSSLVCESGEERRRFANTVLSQMHPVYLNALQHYNRALSQRNSALKSDSADRDLIAVMDDTLAVNAAEIMRFRTEFASILASSVQTYYSRLSGGNGKAGIVYRPDVDPGDDAAASVSAALRRAAGKDAVLKFTTVGPHRDDFDFLLDGYPIRKCGSQGQQKTFLVALKLAQYDLMRQVYGFAPTLLLDDVFDKLDPIRTANMLTLAGSGDFGQIFITDTNRARLEEIVTGISTDARYFNAVNGEFQAG